VSRVFITKVEDEDVSSALSSCFDGLVSDEFLHGVRKAVIKPNLLNSSPAHSGVTTDLRIVSSLIELLLQRGVEKVFVGESSLINTQQVLEALDVFRLEKLGASVVNFDRGDWVQVVSPAPMVLDRFHLAKTVYDCDLFISAAKMKTHCDTKATLSIKNVLGAISPYDRRVGHKTDINRAIVEAYAYIKANKKFLSIIDAIYALEGKRGPTFGNPIKMDLIIASDDPVAADATCVELMGYDVNKVEHIMLADKIGMGSIENREVVRHRIEDGKVRFEMPPDKMPLSDFLPQIQERLFKKLPYLKFEDKCTHCERCVTTCPGGNIAFSDGKIEIDYQNCLSCLVCCEACNEGALDYRVTHSSIYTIAKGTRDLYWKFRYGVTAV